MPLFGGLGLHAQIFLTKPGIHLKPKTMFARFFGFVTLSQAKMFCLALASPRTIIVNGFEVCNFSQARLHSFGTKTHFSGIFSGSA